MAHVSAPPRVRRIQISALVLLVTAGTLNYVDRATLSIANPLIRQDLGLSIADMGLLLSAFLWAYAFCQLPGGALTDRIGPRRLLGIGLLVWSLAQGLAGMVGSFWQFVIARVFLGAGEAPMFSGAARVVRDWWNVRDRALPTGIWNCSSSLGPTIAPPLLTVLMLTLGWRWMFVLMGVFGVLIAIAWFGIYREVEEVALSGEEAHHLTEGEEERPPDQHVTFAEWGRLFRFRVTWGLILGFFGIVYMVWLFQAWLPGYLEMQRHMSIRATGFVRRHSLCLRRRWQHRRRLDHRQAHGRRVLADQFAQAADHRRTGGHGRVHLYRSRDAEQCDGSDGHLSGGVLRRRSQRNVMGAGVGRCSCALHGVARFDPEFRRLSGWSARAHGDRVHCPGDRHIRPCPVGRRSDRTCFGGRLPDRDPQSANQLSCARRRRR